MSECRTKEHCPTPTTQKRRSPKNARVYIRPRTIRPLGNAHCPTPATQKRPRPKGRQGVHPTPWQCTLSHACHAKEAETQGTPGHTSDPLARHVVPRLPRKEARRPKGRQGVHPTPWQCTLSHTCHAKEAETQGTPGRTSDPLAIHIVPRLPRKRGGDPRDARAYIRPLGNAHCPTPATQKRRRPKGRQGVHPTPWQRTLSHACHAREAETQGTPGRTPDPFGHAHCPTPATQKRRRPKGRQGVHPTPWQCTLSHACHAKEAETQKTPGRTSDPLATHIVPRLPRKRGGDPRDARAYTRPLWSCTLSHACHAKKAETHGTPGRTSGPTPATQKRRRPKGRQGVHPTPWQCTCPTPATQKRRRPMTPGRRSDPLARHITPRLPRKRGGDPRDARA